MREYTQQQLSDILKSDRCGLIIEKDSILHNYKLLLSKNSQIIPVLKANAYGMGAKGVAQILQDNADIVAVATLDEGLELRAHTNVKRILVLFPVQAERVREAEDNDIELAVCDYQHAVEINKNAKYGICVHIAINTGMNRYGFDYRDIGTALRIKDLNKLTVNGIYTHMATADNDGEFVKLQKQRFDIINKILQMRSSPLVHTGGGSLAVQGFGGCIRAGISLYGINTFNDNLNLKGAFAFYGKITHVALCRAGEGIGYNLTYVCKRDMKIAIVGAGYADGVPYLLKNCGYVFINNKFLPILGSVCMDCFAIDITGCDDIAEGMYVKIITADKDEKTGIDVIAKETNTIAYELMTSISSRVKRAYV